MNEVFNGFEDGNNEHINSAIKLLTAYRDNEKPPTWDTMGVMLGGYKQQGGICLVNAKRQKLVLHEQFGLCVFHHTLFGVNTGILPDLCQKYLQKIGDWDSDFDKQFVLNSITSESDYYLAKDHNDAIKLLFKSTKERLYSDLGIARFDRNTRVATSLLFRSQPLSYSNHVLGDFGIVDFENWDSMTNAVKAFCIDWRLETTWIKQELLTDGNIAEPDTAIKLSLYFGAQGDDSRLLTSTEYILKDLIDMDEPIEIGHFEQVYETDLQVIIDRFRTDNISYEFSIIGMNR